MRRLGCALMCMLILSACAPAAVRHVEAGNQRFAGAAYEDAAAEYRRAQVLEPDRAEPYYNAANAHNRLGQVDATQLQTEQALKAADPELAEQAWYNLGNVLFDAEQWPQAIEAYKEALRLQSADLEAKHNLELAMQRLEERDQERKQAQEQSRQTQSGGQEEGAPGEEPGETGKATVTAEGAASSPEGQGDEEERNTQLPEPSDMTEGMTAEQATQLLRALLSDSETLQERLQDTRDVSAPAPEEDW
jgi:Ca-activated chloride channel family protein